MPHPTPNAFPFPIVGIGASAGGIEALQAFFEALPARLEVAFVVVIHLSPEHCSELAAILARMTPMPVEEISGTVPLEADRVYVIPPDRRLQITNAEISAFLFEQPRGQRAPIDLFFRSLAEQYGDGFAVILSGGGSDGAVGVKAVKEQGGLILVQDPKEAAFDGMPRAAIATGAADLVLPVRELAQRLGELIERKRAAEALRQSETRFRALIEASAQIVWTTDAKGEVIEDSPSWRAFTGQRYEEWKGWGWVNAVHPEDRDYIVENWRRSVEIETPLNTEYRLYHAPSEQWRWTKVRAVPLRDEAGVVRGWVGMNSDITERRQAEDALRESEERLQFAIDASGAGVYEHAVPLDASTYHGPRWARILGYHPDELPPYDRFLEWIFAQIHPDDQASVGAAYEDFIEGRTPRYNVEVRLRHKQGHWVWVHAISRATEQDEHGRVRRLVGMMFDITQRKRAEAALRDSEERLAAEADALARLNKLSSRLWRMLDLSQGLEEMLTATIDLLGADMGNIQLLDGATLRIATQRGFKQDFLDFFREVSTEDESACGRALRTREPIMIEDVEADAAYAPMRDVARAAGYRAVVSTPMIGRDGEPLGMVSAHFRSPHRPEEQEFDRLMLYVRQAADFIERYKIEAALRDTAEQLQRQSERLQEEDRNKDRFLGLLGHELRNPLAAISNTVDVLRLETLSAPERRGLERIGPQVGHLLRLVDDLLNITRISRGQIELQKTPIDLADSITDAVDQVRPRIEACHHRLTLSLPDQPLCVQADRERLTQIVSNLLGNAAHYTEPGGEITLTVQRAGDQALLKVRDTGIGIAPEHLPQLFEPFRRLVSAAGHYPSGLGLGLALARQLAELHGGSLEAFSDGPGQGSEFTLRLPALPAKQSVMPAPPPTGRHGETETPDRRVLVVEDDVAVGDALVLLLRALGHEVRIVTRGGEASEAVRTFHPELVLLDIGLPDMSGYEVARRLRQENDLQAFRLVALTGFGGDEDLAQVKAAGFDCRLLKPMRMDALQAILRGI